MPRNPPWASPTSSPPAPLPNASREASDRSCCAPPCLRTEPRPGRRPSATAVRCTVARNAADEDPGRVRPCPQAGERKYGWGRTVRRASCGSQELRKHWAQRMGAGGFLEDKARTTRPFLGLNGVDRTRGSSPTPPPPYPTLPRASPALGLPPWSTGRTRKGPARSLWGGTRRRARPLPRRPVGARNAESARFVPIQAAFWLRRCSGPLVESARIRP